MTGAESTPLAMPSPPSMFEPPRPAVRAPQSDYIQPNLGHGLRIWWAFWWPTTLVASALTFATIYAVRSLYENLVLPASIAGPAIKYNAYFFTYFVAFFVMSYILRKNFRHFRIGLLSNYGGEGAAVVPPTIRRTFRIWWTYSWRSLLYRLIVLFAVSFPLGWIVGFLAAIFKNAAVGVLLNLLTATAVDAAAGLFVIYSNILDEDISDFRVALLPPSPSRSDVIVPGVPPTPAPPPTPAAS
jgi:hypothetical protein